ncbi:MAG: PH domain-containing protein [Nitrososphaerota archaeon]|nr:PH domain-containing protein [Nitrososphaerota archaeon]
MSAPVPDDLQKVLGPNEQPQLYIAQKIYHPKINIDSVLITNQRVILRHPHAMGLKKDYTDFNYQDVANVVLDKGFTRSTLKLVLRLGGEPLALQDLPNSEAQKAYGLIRENLGRYQAPFAQGLMNVPPYQQAPQAQPPSSGGATTVIEREVVKIKCRYCGALNDESAKACVNCGASL